MFHHFHDDNLYTKSQGSINKDTLYKLIKYIGRENILNAEEFIIRLHEKKLSKKNVCFTFDDGLKSQYQIALPVLENENIKSFYFIFSSIFTGKPDYLEVYSYFRNNLYKNVDQFYKSFYKKIKLNSNLYFKNKKKYILKKKKNFKHYSIEDIKFRYVRDYLINNRDYKKIMLKLFEEKNFDYKKKLKDLYINKSDLKIISNLGNLIGLHSHNHPTMLENLSKQDQKNEYLLNNVTLKKITNKNIISASHPCGSYDNHTIEIFKKLKIKIAFRRNMIINKLRGMRKINNSFLEIARQNHSHLINEIK